MQHDKTWEPLRRRGKLESIMERQVLTMYHSSPGVAWTNITCTIIGRILVLTFVCVSLLNMLYAAELGVEWRCLTTHCKCIVKGLGWILYFILGRVLWLGLH